MAKVLYDETKTFVPVEGRTFADQAREEIIILRDLYASLSPGKIALTTVLIIEGHNEQATFRLKITQPTWIDSVGGWKDLIGRIIFIAAIQAIFAYFIYRH